jgi:hypothetical protein
MMRVVVDFDPFDAHFSPSSLLLPLHHFILDGACWNVGISLPCLRFRATDDLAFLDWSVFCRLSLIRRRRERRSVFGVEQAGNFVIGKAQIHLGSLKSAKP